MHSVKIKGVIKDYAWGNDYFLPSLLGVRNDGPKAEYWMGTHSSGDAVLENGEKFSSYISSDLESAIGKEGKCKFGKFPLLFKILAIEKPLSLQCHPNLEQAKDGWKREEELRKEGRDHNYQDDNEKAEIIYALTPITAMCGFRSVDQIESNFSKYIPSSFMRIFSGKIDSIEKMFFSLYSLPMDDRISVLDELGKSISRNGEKEKDGEFLTLSGIVCECLREYPADIGTLAPLFMNIVHLEPGEALYLKPDTLHAYVLGNGVELMSASDNVLRGGLTKKRVDLDELKRIMEFSSLDVEKVKCEKDGQNRIHMKTESSAFELLRMDSGRYEQSAQAGILIVISGTMRIEDGDEKLELDKGEAAFIPYSSSVRISLEGLAFEAIVP